MTQPKDPKGFLVVLPGEIIEIPQDSDKSWLTLFYSLPKELAEKWKPAFDLPRCPYEVLRTDKYDSIVCDDMFKLLVWDCYSWSAWQFFQVKDRKGNYRDIPGDVISIGANEQIIRSRRAVANFVALLVFFTMLYLKLRRIFKIFTNLYYIKKIDIRSFVSNVHFSFISISFLREI